MSDIISKIKVYLDTSVISYLEQDDAPEQRDITREIWKSDILIYPPSALQEEED